VDLKQHMADSLGQPVEKLKGTPLRPILPPESCASHQARIQRGVRERQPYRHDTQYNGRWYDSSLTPCLNNQGQMIGVAVVVRDPSSPFELALAAKMLAQLATGSSRADHGPTPVALL